MYPKRQYDNVFEEGSPFEEMKEKLNIGNIEVFGFGNEEDCRNYFTILRESIELILDEKLEQLQKDKKKKEISSALSKISKDIIS